MKPLKILVVDDDRDLALGLAEMMEMMDHQVSVVHSGEDAVSTFTAEHFDIAFMDMKLPGINGVEAFAQIRQSKPDARVVMMTGFRVDQLLEQAVEHGAVRILRKPFTPDEIFGALGEIEPEGIILIADDDPDFCESIEPALADAGYRVLVAHTGQDALDKVVNGDVNLLVLDLRLPIISGIEVYRELKRLGRAVPTIIVTGYRAEELGSIDELQSMSVTGCLFKPFEMKQLMSEIDKIFNAPGATDGGAISLAG